MSNRALTKKQKLFVELYLKLWKPSEAARQAGYKHPDQAGAHIMMQPLVAALIDQRMAEISMETDEVLTRLTQQARVNVGDFLIFEKRWNPKTKVFEMKALVNWGVVKEYGYLVKRISYSRNGDPIVELHDSQAALALIGKARRMFVEQIEETHHLDDTEIKIYIPSNSRDTEQTEIQAESEPDDNA